MGIPKFYRWLSERYPLINQLIADNAFLPEVDNLYLDMNGILHNCSHANDGEIAAKTDKDVLLAVFYYIDRIVHIVKPQKLLYMAIDGVAPRAKLNQQRSRRFRSAKDASTLLAEARGRGEEIDEKTIFDSNCITPGTEWMGRMSSMIKYFIKRKLKEDPLWQNMRVIFSGHEVPGEGEHKIIAYIRSMKSQRGYNPNTRHVMYGLDADLVMLSLLSHEPHFSLLREVVDFNSFRRKKNDTKTLTKQIHHDAWQLLHISTVRQYLDAEMRSRHLATKISFSYSVERVIDDFILLCIFVGNDFLPHLPSLDIAESAIDFMFQIYCEELVKSDGYLTDQGTINVGMLERVFARLGEREEDVFASRANDIQKMNQHNSSRRGPKRPQVQAPDWLLAGHDEEGKANEGGSFKRAYYAEKFGIDTSSNGTPEDAGVHEVIVKSYLAGLEWVLRYYYSGVCSWNWFYPFHYAPMASDMRNLQQLHQSVRFEQGKPFKPFEQLLGCLPPRSCTFLPKSYQALMTNSSSPIRDFYPADFRIDMNGKRNPWEGVNLLSFINEERLKDAISSHAPDSTLTDEEKQRNSFGHDLEYRYDVTELKPFVAPHADKTSFPDLLASQSKVRIFRLPPITTAGGKFVPALCRGLQLPYPSYPIVQHLKGTYQLRPLQVNVFGMPSRKETLTLTIDRPTSSEKIIFPESDDITTHSGQSAAPKLLNTVVHIDWPHTRPALVVAVSDRSGEYIMKGKGEHRGIMFKQHRGDSVDGWRQAASGDWNGWLHGHQVPGNAGVDIGDVHVRVGVRPMVAMRRDPTNGAMSRQYIDDDSKIEWRPMQLIILDHPAPDARFDERSPVDISEVAAPGKQFLYLGDQPGPEAHGCLGTIVSGKVDPKNKSKYMCDIDLTVYPPEPPFGKLLAKTVKERYFKTKQAAFALKISPSTFGRIVSTFRCGPFDIGLNLKVKNRSKFLYLPGYARPVTTNNTKKIVSRGPAWNSTKETQERFKSDRYKDETKNEHENEDRIVWEWSKATIQTVDLYKRKFPRVFQALEQQSRGEYRKFNPRDVCGSDDEFDRLCLWLQQLRTYKLPLVPSESSGMCKAACQAVQTASETQRTKSLQNGKVVRLKDVPMHLLFFGDFIGTANEGEYGAGTDQVVDWELGSRVVNIRSSFVPFGMRGTIIALHPTTGTVEVIFDASFIGGNTLHGICSNGRGRVVKWTDLLAVDAANVKAPKELVKETTITRATVGETKESKRKTTSTTTTTTKFSASSSSSKKKSSQKKGTTNKAAAVSTGETKKNAIPVVQGILKKGKDQKHLNSLLSNMNKDPKKKQETAHLNRLLANATKSSPQQQQQQQQQMQMQQMNMQQLQMQMQQQQQQMMHFSQMQMMQMQPNAPMLLPSPVLTSGNGIGPMPTSASSLGPMPSSNNDAITDTTKTDSGLSSPATSSPTKKIPRKKKKAGAGGLLMPSSLKRST